MDELSLYNLNGLGDTMNNLPDYDETLSGNTINLVTRKKALLTNPMICQYNSSGPTNFLQSFGQFMRI
jgi:hypothetical protein